MQYASDRLIHLVTVQPRVLEVMLDLQQGHLGEMRKMLQTVPGLDKVLGGDIAHCCACVRRVSAPFFADISQIATGDQGTQCRLDPVSVVLKGATYILAESDRYPSGQVSIRFPSEFEGNGFYGNLKLMLLSYLGYAPHIKDTYGLSLHDPLVVLAASPADKIARSFVKENGLGKMVDYHA